MLPMLPVNVTNSHVTGCLVVLQTSWLVGFVVEHVFSDMSCLQPEMLACWSLFEGNEWFVFLSRLWWRQWSHSLPSTTCWRPRSHTNGVHPEMLTCWSLCLKLLSLADVEDQEVTCLQPKMLALICDASSAFKTSRQARRRGSWFPTEPWSMPSSYHLGPQFLLLGINWACCSHCAFYFSGLLKHVDFWKVVNSRIPEVLCLLWFYGLGGSPFVGDRSHCSPFTAWHKVILIVANKRWACESWAHLLLVTGQTAVHPLLDTRWFW